MLDVFDYLPERTRIRLVGQYNVWLLIREIEGNVAFLRHFVAWETASEGSRPWNCPPVFFQMEQPREADCARSPALAHAYSLEDDARAARHAAVNPGALEAGTYVLLDSVVAHIYIVHLLQHYTSISRLGQIYHMIPKVPTVVASRERSAVFHRWFTSALGSPGRGIKFVQFQTFHTLSP